MRGKLNKGKERACILKKLSLHFRKTRILFVGLSVSDLFIGYRDSCVCLSAKAKHYLRIDEAYMLSCRYNKLQVAARPTLA